MTPYSTLDGLLNHTLKTLCDEFIDRSKLTEQKKPIWVYISSLLKRCRNDYWKNFRSWSFSFLKLKNGSCIRFFTVDSLCISIADTKHFSRKWNQFFLNNWFKKNILEKVVKVQQFFFVVLKCFSKPDLLSVVYGL